MFWFAGRKRLLSSTRQWALRQASDPYVKAAQREEYRSRAAFKLLQINQKHGIFAKGKWVVDLGASPGGWSQIASNIVRQREGQVVAIDLLPMESIPGVTFIQGDFTSPDTLGKIKDAFSGGKRPDIVLSDMAPNITGIRDQDHIRSLELVKAAFDFARQELVTGGHFVAKIFEGRFTKDVEVALSGVFNKVIWSKPDASRKESSEMYIIGLGKLRK